MTRKYKKYSDLEFKNCVLESKSIAEVLRKLNLRAVGGNYLTVKKKIQRLNLDTSHFTGRGWNKGKQLKLLGNYSRPTKVKQILSKKRGWKCQLCSLETWNFKPIPLECHHLDKDRSNNTEENLLLLCRNCHFTIHNKL